MDSNNKKQANKWLALINIPFQMGLIIFLGVIFGQWLDEKFKIEGSILTIVFSLLAVFIALYNVIRQVNKMSNDKKE
ncbi:AtpZ/AtpI family protein [Flavobacterium sp. HXWNR29]|uniref:AtpZ/AtpI family protein n=1 Tax=Flavobacterium odoriferum TaxID=2946604 RepID=UPI0021CB0ECF|nr:AtpZ/AtpI family protein [Flavobacterium sp. HXWNR29]MCU4187795.1 AtpZ/AtpI family protein [Flavobacterium sp. HXWNR29]